jgi:hypothetical protein
MALRTAVGHMMSNEGQRALATSSPIDLDEWHADDLGRQVELGLFYDRKLALGSSRLESGVLYNACVSWRACYCCGSQLHE